MGEEKPINNSRLKWEAVLKEFIHTQKQTTRVKKRDGGEEERLACFWDKVEESM